MILKPYFLSSILNSSNKGPCAFLADAFSCVKLNSKISMANLIKKQSTSFAKSYQVLKQLILIMVSCMLLTSCKASAYKNTLDQKMVIPTEPVWYPFDVTKKGTKLEVMVRVEIPDTYGFYLCFYTDRPEYKNHKRRFGEYGPIKLSFWDMVTSFFPEKTLSLTKEQSEYNDRLSEMMLGEKFVDHHFIKTKKALTPVKIQLFSEEGVKIPIFYFNEKTRESEQVPDEGIEPTLYSLGESHNKTIGATGLMPGVYKIIIETLKDAPELKGIKVEFGFHTDIRRK